MSYIKTNHIFGNFLFALLISVNVYCQNNINTDSTFQHLGKSYYKYETKDSILARKYAFTYLEKGKNEKDSIKTANAYYFISRFFFQHNNTLCLKFADSAINITKIKNGKHLPCQAYINKASFNYINGNLESSLENYIYANEYAIKTNNISAQNSIKYFISVLKNRLGHHKEAIELSKEIIDLFEENNQKIDYLNVVFNLASSYSKLSLNDSATYYNKLGYKKSIEFQDSLMSNYFTLNEGVNQVGKKNYRVALDSLLKSVPKIKKNKDVPNIILSQYYLGFIYNEQDNIEKSIFHLTSMDTLLISSKEVIQEVRHGYEILIDHYKSRSEINKQLLYIDRLIRFDSVNHNSYKKLSKDIATKYDTRQLIKEKNDLKEKLNLADVNERYSKWKMLTLMVIIILAILIIYYNYRKRLFYKKRFEELINNVKIDNDENQKMKIKRESLSIPTDIINSILEKLEIFEKKHEYLEKELNRETLAQKFGTNTKYISKIINHYKNKSFRDYINDLRVQYAVQELKENGEIRKYTIKSIASDLGYKSVDSFSKAFKKKTGMQVSYFIKKLENS